MNMTTTDEKSLFLHKHIKFIFMLIFFFSGFATLMYQVVWQRLFTIYYGVGSLSVTIIVTIFMAGLGFGALFGGWIAERVKSQLFVYCIIELLIGGFGAISPLALDFLGVNSSGASRSMAIGLIFSFLIFPTFLMGMTLPLMTRAMHKVLNHFMESLSGLYFTNTLGAAMGALFTAYVVISFFGFYTAIWIAVTLNALLAISVLFIDRIDPTRVEKIKASPDQGLHENKIKNSSRQLLFLLPIIVLMSGFVAIGYEIVWFRVVAIITKSSVYAFASILSVYLLGIALGSAGINRFLAKRPNIDKVHLYFSIQCCISIFAVLAFVSLYFLTLHTPISKVLFFSFGNILHPPLHFGDDGSAIGIIKDIILYLDIFIWSAFFLIIPALLMGASFPLVTQIALSRFESVGGTVGSVYAINVLGNILGGVVTGLILLTFLGTSNTLIALSLISAIIALIGIYTSSKPSKLARPIGALILLLGVLCVMLPSNEKFYRLIHSSTSLATTSTSTHFDEGLEGVILSYEQGDEFYTYINGMIHGGRPGWPFQSEALVTMGYVPNAKRVMILGYGTGALTEAVTKNPNIEEIILVELSGTLIRNLRRFETFQELLADKRIKLVIEDGRRFLNRETEKFDIIFIDPVRTTTAYSNNLYSKQMFELIGTHLTDEGAFLVWSDEDIILPATVASAFSYLRKYKGYTIGFNHQPQFDEDFYGKLLENYTDEEQAILRSYVEFLYTEAKDNNIENKATINTDWSPKSEYYLGRQKHYSKAKN